MYKRYGQCVAALVRKSWARLSWLSWLLAAVAFGFRAFVASGFCGFWLSWLSWLLASVAFGFRGFGGFWLLWLLAFVASGFWCSWLLAFVAFVASGFCVAFGFRGFKAHKALHFKVHKVQYCT